jgi:hypothetical protein
MATYRVRARLLRGLIPLALFGTLSACQSALGPEKIVQVLEVAPQKIPCVGVAPQECLQVREPGQAQWNYFYDPIDGFTFVTGFSYVLRVERTAVDNPAADGSSYSWRLLEIVSQAPAS